jgi:hypothetical protein
MTLTLQQQKIGHKLIIKVSGILATVLKLYLCLYLNLQAKTKTILGVLLHMQVN